MKSIHLGDYDPSENDMPTTQYLTAANIILSTIEEVPSKEAKLSLSQYRLLLRICEFGANIKSQKELAVILHLKDNVVSQSISVLEKRGFVTSVPLLSDKRIKISRATDEGIQVALEVADKIHEKFEYIYIDVDNWITEAIEEVAVYRGSCYEGCSPMPFEGKINSERITSHVVSGQHLNQKLREQFDITLTEGRMLKLLGEMGEPARPVDIAYQLIISQAAINKMTNELEKRGWLRRIGARNSKRAVFVELTEQGFSITEGINQEMRNLFCHETLATLNEKQRKALICIAPHILGRIYADYAKSLKIIPLK